MGSFGGHALPGVFFITYSLWLTVMATRRYCQSKKRGSQFMSSASFTCLCCCGKQNQFPLESVIKLTLIPIAFFLEIYTAYENGVFVYMGNAQHSTMYFFFIIGSIVELLMFCKIPLPPNADYIVLAMSFMAEGLLFKFHLHGRSPLDVLVHTVLLYTVYACVISVIVEMKYKHSILSPLARAYLVLLQGTWFWQLGFILYNPAPGAVPWKADGHDDMTLATLYFTWHALVDFIIIIIVTMGVQACFRRCGYHMAERISYKRFIHSGCHEETVVSLQDDHDSANEFE